MLCWRYFEVAVTNLNQFPPSNRKFNIQEKDVYYCKVKLYKIYWQKTCTKESSVCTKGTKQTNPCKMQPSSVNLWCFKLGLF